MTSEHSIDAAKRSLREDMRARRRGLTALARSEGAAAIAEQALDFSRPAPGAVVAGYAAIRDELDPAALLVRLADAGHPIALPVIAARGEPLRFHRWTPGAPLQPGEYAVPVPGADAPAVVPDILLVPLLAYDARGYRLGYGAGYYDRTIAELRSERGVLAVGLAFDIQQVENVPHDGYDERLDWVLTPAGPSEIER